MDAPPSDPTPGDPAGGDPFGPPAEPCECRCLHCRRTFMSTGIWWQRELLPGGKESGMWLCPTPNCDGAGFTFDIFPTDPDHPANQGWHASDDDGEGDESEGDDGEGDDGEAFEDDDDGNPSEADAPYDPAEPQYTALDAEAAEHGDIEGDEWKHGLVPGDPPPTPAWAEASRREREAEEAEEARYDAPDERPWEIDRTHDRSPGPSADTDDGADAPF